MIKYSIFQTRLQNEDIFVARTISQGTYNLEALIERMLEMGSSLTKPDISAVLQLFSTAVEKICSQGYRVNLDGLVRFSPALGGRFDNKNDTFNNSRNSVYLTAQISKTLNDRIQSTATVEKLILDENRPILLEVSDSEADSGVDDLSVGNIIAITGKRLKFDPAKTDEYLRLVNTARPSEFVPIIKFHKISDQELVFRLPKTSFTQGHFELANSMGTFSVRVGRSRSFAMMVQ